VKLLTRIKYYFRRRPSGLLLAREIIPKVYGCRCMECVIGKSKIGDFGSEPIPTVRQATNLYDMVRREIGNDIGHIHLGAFP